MKRYQLVLVNGSTLFPVTAALTESQVNEFYTLLKNSGMIAPNIQVKIISVDAYQSMREDTLTT